MVPGVQVFQADTEAAHHAGKWLGSDAYGHARCLRQTTVESTQLRPATGQHHAVFHQIGRKLRMTASQRSSDRLYDGLQGAFDRLTDFFAAQQRLAWQTTGYVATPDG